MWVAFAVQKLLTFFSAKNIRLLYIESAKTVNEMTLNELVKQTMLWTSGPRMLDFCFASVMRLLTDFFSQKIRKDYHNNSECWDRQAWTNSVDLHQMPQNADLIRVSTVCHSSRYILDMSVQNFRVNTGSPHSLTLSDLRAKVYHIYIIYSDTQTWPNSEDPDEMPKKTASHQGLHCLPLIQQFLVTTSGSKLYLFRS